MIGWYVQGTLMDAETGQPLMKYGRRRFRTKFFAQRFKKRLYQDHGPGMVKVDMRRGLR